MAHLNNWIDEKLRDISRQLPSLIHTEPASFACGYNEGYKQALLDFERKLNVLIELGYGIENICDIYQTKK